MCKESLKQIYDKFLYKLNLWLIDKGCSPCKCNVLPLDEVNVTKLLGELGLGWSINNAGHLYKQYKFEDFIEPIRFANRIAELAEQIKHHPNLTISWGKVAVEIWTHKINGLSENDFILASRIETVLEK